MEIFETIGRLYSRSITKRIEEELEKSALLISGERFLGFVTVVYILISILFGILVYYYHQSTGLLTSLFGFSGLMAILFSFLFSFIFFGIFIPLAIYGYISLKRDSILERVESQLPDFLTLAAANMRGGMNLDQALWHAAKPEFGDLSVAIRIAVSSSLSGESIHVALKKLGSMFDSKLLKRTTALISQSVSSGGEVAEVLENIARDSRESYLIKKDISSSLLFYQIFVFFGASVGAPFLFAISHKLLEMLEKIFSTINLDYYRSSGISGFITPTGPSVSALQFFYFSLATIFITNLFSALTIGIIRKSKWQEGLKYFVPMFIISLIVFYGTNILLNGVFTYLLPQAFI